MSFSLGDIDEAKDKLGHMVKVSISNVSIHGFPATGKTSVIRLVKGLSPPPKKDQISKQRRREGEAEKDRISKQRRREGEAEKDQISKQRRREGEAEKDQISTGVAEPPSSSIIVGDSTDGGEWETFTSKGMLEALYGSVKSQALLVGNFGTVDVKHRAQPTSALSQITQPASHSVSSPINLPSQPSPRLSPPPPRPSPSLPRPSPPSIEDTSATKHKDKVPPILMDIIKDLAKIRGSSRVFSTRWILISDSGGQPNYLDVFPLFVRNKCLALFTLKLSERLDYIPKFSYCVNGKEMTDMAKLQCSHEQLLESFVKSMSSFHPSLGQSSNARRRACYAVIGTFDDERGGCEKETLKDKNINLTDSLKAYKDLQIRENIIPINAIAIDEQRKKHMTELRELIKESPSIEIDIKVIWFGFYLCLEAESKAEERPILSLQECLDIGNLLNMDEQDTRKAIQFFHNLNLLLHYPTDALDDFVIIKLKPIFDLVSKLINASILNENDLREHFQLRLRPPERERLKKMGVFPNRLWKITLLFQSH